MDYEMRPSYHFTEKKKNRLEINDSTISQEITQILAIFTNEGPFAKKLGSHKFLC